MPENSTAPNPSAAVRPLLSVCIPTFNRDKYLIQSLRSFLLQIEPEYRNQIEVIVSNNDSPDATEQVVQSLLPLCPYMRYLRQATNIGPGLNLAATIKAARGEYLWNFGDDDVILENCLRTVMPVLASRRFGLVYLNRMVMNKDLSEVINEKMHYLSGDIQFASASDLCSKFGFFTQLGFISAIIFRNKPELVEVLSEYNSYESRYQQNGMFVECFKSEPCLVKSEPLLIHRQFNQCSLQTQAWPEAGALPLLRTLQRLKQQGALDFRQLEGMIETPLYSKPNVTLDIFLDCLDGVVKSRPVRITPADWTSVFSLVDALENPFYKQRFQVVFNDYLDKLEREQNYSQDLEALLEFNARRDSGNPSVHARYALYLGRQGRNDLAGRALQRAISLSQGAAEIIIKLVNLFVQAKLFEPAILALKSMALKPDCADQVLFALAQLYALSARPRECVEIMQLLLQRPNTQIEYVWLYVDALKAIGHSAEACSVLEQVSLQLPALPDVHSRLAALYLETRQLDRAFNSAKQALTLKPDSREHREACVQLLRMMGREGEAQQFAQLS